MQKLTLPLLFIFLFSSIIGFCQLPDGTTAPNFTSTDINGNTYTLYDYLDAGKPVILDISATWCAPCWNYHESHELRDLYDQYGPDGTNELMVFYVEGDPTTTLANLQGTGNTQGDWVTGTTYPILDDASIADSYTIGWFPTIYMICPDKKTKLLEQLTAEQLYAEATTCPGLSVISEFTSDVTMVTAGGTANFSDLTEGNPDTWSWSFPGGSPATSTGQNPSVTYNTPGTYEVSLTATNSLSGNSDTETKSAYMTVLGGGLAPVSEFSASTTTVLPNGVINYTDLSTGNPTQWNWSFPGGSPSSSATQNPTITYATNGSYDVTLTITNAQGNNTMTKSSYITVSDADFCIASGGCEEHISKVEIGSISNFSTCDGYSDFTNQSTIVQAGVSYPITVTNSDWWTGDINGCWIDFNYDGDFEDSGEAISLSSLNSNGESTGMIAIPGNPYLGTVRMRIRSQYEGVLMPCGVTSFGEVEDYSLTIVGSSNAATAGFSADATTVIYGSIYWWSNVLVLVVSRGISFYE
jgi:PKD repeat protein